MTPDVNNTGTNKENRYVAAIEISSSKIVAVVGKTQPEGRLEIIASEQEKGVEGVRYGIIQNLDETSMRAARILERLKRKPSIAPREITGLFVGLSGRSLRSIRTDVKLSLPDDTEINDAILDRLQQQAESTAIDSSLEVVDAIPRCYVVGNGAETLNPKGAIGNRISATFDLIVCRPELRRNLTRAITDKLGIDINGFVVTPLSTAQMVLTPEEKRLGCMLVDMGAETTTVTIYTHGHLTYFATLPLGGRNITRDVMSKVMLEEKAEEIKLNIGHALPVERAGSITMNGVRTGDISNLIVARAEEIVANIVEQIEYAGLKESDLHGGIICIGGGSKLNGILDLLNSQTGLTTRRGYLPNYIALDDTKMPAPELLEVCSILYSGAMNSDAECLETPGKEELPVTGVHNPETPAEPEPKRPKPSPRSSFFGKMSDKISQFFAGGNEDDSDIID